MKTPFFDSLLLILRNSGQIGLALTRKIFFAVRKMSWLQILIIAFAVVLTIAILHVALFLFVVFMVFKLIAVSTLFKGKSSNRDKFSFRKDKPHHRPAGEPYTIDM